MSLWLQNLLAYCLQVAGLAAAGVLAPRLLRLRAPRLLYFYWQGLLATCLLLPLLQPWERIETARGGTAASHIFLDVASTASGSSGFPVASLVLIVLVAGMMLRLAWLTLGLMRLGGLRDTARPIETVPQAIQETAARLGVAPVFGLSAEIQGPATFGLRRPAILLPPRFREMDAAQQQAIASHELLHVARHDWAFNLAEEITLAGFWFHPAVWWLVGRIRLSREQVVDQSVVELTGARKPYLYALVEIAAGAGAARAIVAPAFLKESQLVERIRTLLKGDHMSKRKIAIALATVVMLTLLAGLASVRAFPLKAGGSAPSPATAKKDQTTPGVVKVGDKGVTAPVVTYKPEPPYTKEARDAKLEGKVILSVVVAPDGSVSDVKPVREGVGMGLTESAVNTVKTWKFSPALKYGKPVACRIMVEVSFKIF